MRPRDLVGGHARPEMSSLPVTGPPSPRSSRIKRLDDLHTLKEAKAARTGKPGCTQTRPATTAPFDAFRTNAGAMAGFEGWRINVDDFLPRFAITQPFDILPNIISIPFGQFAINAQHSAVLKKAVSVSADPFIVLMNRRVLNCRKKHRPRQTLETNGPFTFLSHIRITPPCRLAQTLDFECG